MLLTPDSNLLRAIGLGILPEKKVSDRKAAIHGIKEIPHGVLNRLPGGEYMDSYRREWQHFIEAIQNDKPVGCTLEDGRRALQIALSAVESASSGRSVTLNQAPKEVAPIKSR